MNQRLVICIIIILLILFTIYICLFKTKPFKKEFNQSIKSTYVKNEHVDNVFDNIYKNAVWGRGNINGGGSGSGSTIENNKNYIAFLNDYIKKNNNI